VAVGVVEVAAAVMAAVEEVVVAIWAAEVAAVILAAEAAGVAAEAVSM
jgi:hypothetical protein